MPSPPTPAEIRAARQRLGLSQQALADRLGIAMNTVARWELPPQSKHRRTPTGLYLRELRRLMDEAGNDTGNEG